MKKYLFLSLPIFWAFASCKNDSTAQEADQGNRQDSIVMWKVNKAFIDEISQLQVPELRDSLNTVFLLNYKNFATDYLRAMEKNDTQKVRDLHREAEDWSEKTKIFINKLNSNELEKVNVFMQQLSTQLDSIKKMQ